jgi:hypothetical protein
MSLGSKLIHLKKTPRSTESNRKGGVPRKSAVEKGADTNKEKEGGGER